MYVHTVAEIQIKHQNYTITTKLMRMQDKFSKSSHLAPMQNDILMFPAISSWLPPAEIVVIVGKDRKIVCLHIADVH